MKKNIFGLMAFLFVSGSVYACKCKDPGTVKEAFSNTPFVIHGRVVRVEQVSFQETVTPKKAKVIQENLKDDSSRLQLFESRMIAKVEIEILEKFKGSYRKKTVIIYTPESSASCGFSFEAGKEYVIYATPGTSAYATFLPESKRSKKAGKKYTYWTSLCTRTTSDAQQEVAQLRLAVR